MPHKRRHNDKSFCRNAQIQTKPKTKETCCDNSLASANEEKLLILIPALYQKCQDPRVRCRLETAYERILQNQVEQRRCCEPKAKSNPSGPVNTFCCPPELTKKIEECIHKIQIQCREQEGASTRIPHPSSVSRLCSNSVPNNPACISTKPAVNNSPSVNSVPDEAENGFLGYIPNPIPIARITTSNDQSAVKNTQSPQQEDIVVTTMLYTEVQTQTPAQNYSISSFHRNPNQSFVSSVVSQESKQFPVQSIQSIVSSRAQVPMQVQTDNSTFPMILQRSTSYLSVRSVPISNVTTEKSVCCPPHDSLRPSQNFNMEMKSENYSYIDGVIRLHDSSSDLLQDSLHEVPRAEPTFDLRQSEMKTSASYADLSVQTSSNFLLSTCLPPPEFLPYQVCPPPPGPCPAFSKHGLSVPSEHLLPIPQNLDTVPRVESLKVLPDNLNDPSKSLPRAVGINTLQTSTVGTEPISNTDEYRAPSDKIEKCKGSSWLLELLMSPQPPCWLKQMLACPNPPSWLQELLGACQKPNKLGKSTDSVKSCFDGISKCEDICAKTGKSRNTSDKSCSTVKSRRKNKELAIQLVTCKAKEPISHPRQSPLSPLGASFFQLPCYAIPKKVTRDCRPGKLRGCSRKPATSSPEYFVVEEPDKDFQNDTLAKGSTTLDGQNKRKRSRSGIIRNNTEIQCQLKAPKRGKQCSTLTYERHLPPSNNEPILVVQSLLPRNAANIPCFLQKEDGEGLDHLPELPSELCFSAGETN